ncbi:cilia-and flagella-associated protein 96-like [Montipora capricornis]|uniref:cilia-and flagella-associated protein 96-like n=1 Tax=Montipora foliosa TaxID=591990 RepID=UPI0035F17103
MSKLDTKNDLNRVGLFSELGYISIGDPYKRQGTNFNVAAHKGKQMLPGGSKTRSALQSGYFDQKFTRIMESEAFTDPVKRRRQDKLKSSKLNIGKAFVPSNGEKLPSGAGNHYGTFSGAITAFSPVVKGKKAIDSPGKNFLTNPPKKGTGFGYLHVTIGASPKYISDAYDRARDLRNKEMESSFKARKGGAFKLNLHPKAFFDGNPYKSDRGLPPLKEGRKPPEILKPFKPSSPPKEIGGMKAGCFDSYPSHSEDPYRVKKKNGSEGDKKIFRPSQGPKSTPTRSIINQNVKRRINNLNFRQPITISI